MLISKFFKIALLLVSFLKIFDVWKLNVCQIVSAVPVLQHAQHALLDMLSTSSDTVFKEHVQSVNTLSQSLELSQNVATAVLVVNHVLSTKITAVNAQRQVLTNLIFGITLACKLVQRTLFPTISLINVTVSLKTSTFLEHCLNFVLLVMLVAKYAQDHHNRVVLHVILAFICMNQILSLFAIRLVQQDSLHLS